MAQTRQFPDMAERYPDLVKFVGHDYYVCCNLRFDDNRNATDANYFYLDARVDNVVSAGTPVRALAIRRGGLELQPNGSDRTYFLRFTYGAGYLTRSQYFSYILRDTAPTNSGSASDPKIAGAINDGVLVEGMTKDEALRSRGYPPFHRTSGIESDVWLYYDSPRTVTRIRFAEGKIARIEHGAAP